MTSSSSSHKYILLSTFDYGPIVIPARHPWIRGRGLGFLTNKGRLFLQRCFSVETSDTQLLTLRNGWFLDEPHFFLYAVFSQLPSRQESLGSKSGIFCSEERSGFLETRNIGSQYARDETLISVLKMCCQKLLSQQQSTFVRQVLNLNNTIFVLIPSVSVQDKSY